MTVGHWQASDPVDLLLDYILQVRTCDSYMSALTIE